MQSQMGRCSTRAKGTFTYACDRVAFFDIQAGLRLAIWKRKDIVHDTKLIQTVPSSTEFTMDTM